MTYRTLLLFQLVFSALVLSADPAAVLASGPGAGADLVETHCTRCHAVGASATSPHPSAPRFVDVVDLYPPASLAEAFAEGIIVGHPDMPAFRFSPQQIDAIIGYFESLY